MGDYDARLVELYDDDNHDGPDHDFYRQVADEIGARSVLDVGCGTGILTATFVRPGRAVVGIDPSRNMLAYAANRLDGRAVRWIPGDSRDIPDERFDYAVMTGNVAQHIPDSDWERTLADINGALRDGGVLVFESRTPQARAWESWANEEPTIRVTASGPLREWSEVSETEPGRVVLTAHNLFEVSGNTSLSSSLSPSETASSSNSSSARLVLWSTACGVTGTARPTPKAYRSWFSKLTEQVLQTHADGPFCWLLGDWVADAFHPRFGDIQTGEP